MNTRFKGALWVGLVGILMVVSFGAAIYYFQNKFAYGDFYKRLETRVSLSSQLFVSGENKDITDLQELRNKYLERLDNEREIILTCLEPSCLDSLEKTHSIPHGFIEQIMKEGSGRAKNGALFYAGTVFNHQGQAYLVILSAENYYVIHHLGFLKKLLLIGVLVIVLLIVFFTFYYSKHIFDPIRDITNRVKAINTESIDLRLEYKQNNPDIDELVRVFNDLLNRIETTLETQKSFISNASHEIGTPLTTIIGEAEVALMKERSKEDYQKAIQNILFQAERLNEISTSLFSLAQTGYKGKALAFERLRMDEMLWTAKSIIDKLIPENNILVDLSMVPDDPKKLKFMGSRELIQLAIANVLRNACKYSNNAEVKVNLVASDKHVILTVEDKGIGIPNKDMEYIYDPFFRASNVGLIEGYGIGLPLTRNIVNIHQGSLEIISQVNKGTTVIFRIPIAPLR